METADRTDARDPRIVRWAGAAGWAVLLLTVPGCSLLPPPWGGGPESIVGTVMLPAFFVILVIRLGLALRDGHRPPRAVLLGALALWGIGSLQYSAASADHLTSSATPGVSCYIVAYTLITVYLLTDLPRRGRLSAGIWVDAVIVAGGAACLAGSALVITTNVAITDVASGRMVALLYPMLDLLLAGLVLYQRATGARPAGRTTWALGAAFCFLALSDAVLAQGIFQGLYVRRPIVDVTCGIGLWLLVSAACATRRGAVPDAADDRRDRMPITASAGAAFVGLIVAIASPPATETSFVMVPALLTLVAAQVRMWLARREARGASEARALSLTDDLTGLPNRRAMTQQVNARIAAGERLALVLLDLDGFKEINDGLGHNAGDTLLRLAAERVQATVSPQVMVARIGGDEFAILVPLTDGEQDVLDLTRAVLTALREPYAVDGVQLTVEGSIGIALREADDTVVDAVELLRRADVAMYGAKAARSGPQLYDAESDQFSRGRLELVESLRKAMDAGQIEMWYQPQTDARSGSLCGLEALVRWRHPSLGLVAPGIFLPAARRAGLMTRLSEEIVRQVIDDLGRWRHEDRPVPPVSINIAPAELLGGAVVPFLLDELHRSGLAHSSVVLEVTEDSFVSDPERAREVLERLSAAGIGVSIDDYGTGFSSLAYLRDLPVQELKIDRSFVAAIDHDERSRMIVSSTTSLAHALAMRVVAEGVEDAVTARRLLDLGVDRLQGYHVARPMPFAKVAPWIEAHRGRSLPVQAARGAKRGQPASNIA